MPERIRDLRPTWVAFGWFLAAAIASLILIAFTSFGLLSADSDGEALWVGLAILLGFFGAGFFVGSRAGVAPLLHGLAIGLFSLVAWLVLNLLLGEPTGETTWRSLEPVTLGGLLVLQAVAAVVGARVGVRWTRTPPPHTQ
jgi:hypothetical protein